MHPGHPLLSLDSIHSILQSPSQLPSLPGSHHSPPAWKGLLSHLHTSAGLGFYRHHLTLFIPYLWGIYSGSNPGMLTGVSRINALGNSLVVQWLGLHALPARSLGSILGQGPKVPHAIGHHQKTEKRKPHTFSTSVDISRVNKGYFLMKGLGPRSTTTAPSGYQWVLAKDAY